MEKEHNYYHRVTAHVFLILVVINLLGCRQCIFCSAHDSGASSLFDILAIADPLEGTNTALISPPSQTPPARQKALAGLGSNSLSFLTGGEAKMKQRYFGIPPGIADSSLMGLPRGEFSFLSCGAKGFGNTIPRDFGDLVERVTFASRTMRRDNPSIGDFKFDWTVPVTEGRIGVGRNRLIRLSELNPKLVQENDEEDAQDDKDVFKSSDLRYMMSLPKLAVKEDTAAGVYDVFLLQPENLPGSYGSFFQMGVSSDDISSHVKNSMRGGQTAQGSKETAQGGSQTAHGGSQRAQGGSQTVQEQTSSSGRISDETPTADNPEANMEPVVGFLGEEPFLGLLAKGAQQAMVKAQDQAIEDAQKLSIEYNERKRKNKDQVVEGLRMVEDVVNGAKAINTMAGISAQLQPLQSNAEAAAQSKAINSVLNVVDVAGKVAKYALSRRLEEEDSEVQQEVPDNDHSYRTVKVERLQAHPLPVVFADLLVKDAEGNIVFGPVSMFCPYYPIPLSQIKGGKSVLEGEVDVLIFEVSLRTQTGRRICDELDRPIVIKRFLFRENYGSVERTTDGLYEHEKCAALVLGLRILDVDFEQFQEKDGDLRRLVKKSLGKAVGVSESAVRFCDVKKGSTLIAFEVGRDVAMIWDSIVSRHNSFIHQIIQIDRDFPTLVNKDDLLGKFDQLILDEEEYSDSTNPGDEFELVSLPRYNTNGLGDIPNNSTKQTVAVEPSAQEVLDIAESKDGKVFKSGTIAVITISVILAVGLMFMIGVFLFIRRRRKFKFEENVAHAKGSSFYTEAATDGYVLTNRNERQKLGGLALEDAITPANRDAAFA